MYNHAFAGYSRPSSLGPVSQPAGVMEAQGQPVTYSGAPTGANHMQPKSQGFSQMPYPNQVPLGQNQNVMTPGGLRVQGQGTAGVQPSMQQGMVAMTPKVVASNQGAADAPPGASVPMPVQRPPVTTIQSTPAIAGPTPKELALEKKVRELEQLLAEKDQQIQELQVALSNSTTTKHLQSGSISGKKSRSPGRTGSGFRKVSDSKPIITYSAVDQEDPIDVRLEEFYNSTGSAIQFRRINRGFYRFGDSIVEINIINHKLMARTEDGWNRGKFGPIEKFLMYYENIEREKAGIVPEG